jgi:hypothetical protein
VIGRLHCLVIDCPAPLELAGFYAELLGLDRIDAATDWVTLGRGAMLPVLALQQVADFRAPCWRDPDAPGQLHVDVLVDDLDAAEPRVIELGATLLEGSPKPIGYRVYADPVGHPFCLVTPESVSWSAGAP